jgi:hypothetical protein
MKERQSSVKLSTQQSADIIGLRIQIDGAYLLLRCQSCEHRFECYQVTFAGVAIGQHICPQCHAVCEVWPKDFEVALDCYMPPKTLGEMMRIAAEATRIAETWYRIEPLAGILTYQNLNLGEPTERELLAFINLGLYRALSGEGSA